MAAERSFWAWHRTGLASTLVGNAPAGAGRAHVPARLSLGPDRSAEIPVDLLGPGDIAGIDPGEINRTEPADGCPDFEPSAFPYLELRHADMPWRFTPSGPYRGSIADPEHPSGPTVAQQHLQPWVAVVVVREDAAILGAGPNGRTLQCDASDLPNSAESWAWAHVQLTSDTGTDGDAALSDPSRSFARLICPIRLEADRRYLACLVPTYSAGVAAAGLKPRDGVAALDAAWPATGQVTLPVYHSWSFGTADAGSFETLARRLRPRSAPATAAGIPLRIDAAGWGATAPVGATMIVQGALRPLGTAAEAPPDPAFASSLADAVSAPESGLALRPPLYGQDYADGATVVTAGAGGWFCELNTDARRRFAAGLAAWAVAVKQEDLCDRAWQQLSDARSGWGTQAGADIASAVQGALEARHGLTSVSAGVAERMSTSVMTRMTRRSGSLALVSFAAAHLADRQPATPLANRNGSFCPTFGEPALEALSATAPEWVLPGLGDLPADSIVLVRTNPEFVEAFLVGMNHALARELQWRRYPLDSTATLFASFWPAVTGASSAVPPISSWKPDSDLGSHVEGTDQLVLVLRGALLRRFPSTHVYLSSQVDDGAEQIVYPTLEATAGPDTTLVGFPLSLEEILHPAHVGQVFSIVVQESVRHARFGLDDAPPDGTTAALTTWQDLDWANPHLAGTRQVPVAGPLNGVGRPTGPDTAIASPPMAYWGADSAAMAAALTRAPVRVRFPASLWLTTPGA